MINDRGPSPIAEPIGLVGASRRADFQNAAYVEMKPFWTYVDDVLAGTHRLREKATTYLPRNEAEDAEDYKIRVKRAIFYNAYERALDGLASTAFRKDPILTNDVPEPIRGTATVNGYCEDIDMAGTHLNVFAKKVFRNAIHHGHAFIFVDEPAPPQMTNEAGEARDFKVQPLTLAEKKDLSIRPKFVHYRADQAYNWRYQVVNGRTQITQITFREVTTEPYGDFGEQQVVRYRVLRPGSYVVYREKAARGKSNNPTIREESRGELPLKDRIPVAVVYGNELEPLTSRPALLALADLGVEHFQVRSDLRHTMHWASIPLLWARGRDTTKSIQEIGANVLIDVGGDNGELGFAEHQGHAIGGLQTELDKIEGRMAVLSMNFLVEDKPGNPVTATEKVMNYADKSSKLSTMMRSLVDAIELCLEWSAHMIELKDYRRKVSGGSWDLQTEAANLIISPEKMMRFVDMVKNDQLSLETFWDVLQRGGELPANFDATKEKERVDAQRAVRAKELSDAQVAVAAARAKAAGGARGAGGGSNKSETGSGGAKQPETKETEN